MHSNMGAESHKYEENLAVDGDLVVPAGSKTKPLRDKRAKFVRLAESRTSTAIRAIRVIGKLGNRAHYDYSEADVKKITQALSREIEDLRVRMTSKGPKSQIEFKL
jgi:hypothetical protein